MTNDADKPKPPDMLQRHFAALWSTIRQDEAGPRPPDEQRLLLDQIRNAFDRAANRLSDTTNAYIAGTFTVEGSIYRSETTEILQLRHRDLGTLHALKTLPFMQAANAPLIERLRREAAIGLGFRHSTIVETTVLLRLDDGRPALLQDWQGRSLLDLYKHADMIELDIGALLFRLLEALAVIHEQGYVHCDVAPGNIFIPAGDPKSAMLGDFGISLRKGECHSDLGLAFAGSPDFLPPEHGPEKPVDTSHDIYALGRLTAYLLDRQKEQARHDLQLFSAACAQNDPFQRPRSAEDARALLMHLNEQERS
ncbi:protein kinase domain-containing protein [Oryzifoliimicrobium ureilyticus]|uniref:protein kinase domain-containing protein n=1 Tax=Oryzifoliimicrobium ureilyticus TaxID=3113724 RepID=UPI0030761D28